MEKQSCLVCKKEYELVEFCKHPQTANGYSKECKFCKRIRMKEYRIRKKDQLKEYWSSPKVIQRKKEWNAKDYQENKKLYNTRHKKWVESNREKYDKYMKEYHDKYYELNKEKISEYAKIRGAKPEVKLAARAQSAKRRFQRENATPRWADLDGIKAFYQACPEGHTINHIIPLINENVCGLHTLDNLQYLTDTENKQKNNSFDGTHSNESWRHKT